MLTMNISLIIGWIMDKLLGDPLWLPHPVVFFGKAISWGEHRLNRGNHRRLKGGVLAVSLILSSYLLTWLLLRYASMVHLKSLSLATLIAALLIFFCLAGTTLVKEVRMVFEALERGLDEGRRQVARIVGRDTSQLTEQEIKKAALETLAENLSDGVIAPLFWLLLLSGPLYFLFRHSPAFPTIRYSEFFVALVYTNNLLIIASIFCGLLCLGITVELLCCLLTLIPLKQLSGFSYLRTITNVVLAVALVALVLVIVSAAFFFIHFG